MVTVRPIQVDGADISHHQSGQLDLAKAKSQGLKFLYHKCTEGSSFRDSNYHKRRMEASKAGVPFGAYHFARPESAKDAALEVAFFLKNANIRPGDLVPVLDLEVNEKRMSKAQLTEWVRIFVAAVRKAHKVTPMIYTPFTLEKNFGAQLWMARYGPRNLRPSPVKPWLKWDVWQFSNGQLGVPNSHPGLGHVDLNTFNAGVKLGDIRIPNLPAQPDVKGKRSAIFRVVTQNVQALPLMSTGDAGEDIALTARQAGVIFWQEIAPNQYQTKIKQLGDEWSHYFPAKGGKDTPISWRSRFWEVVQKGKTPLHDGVAHIMNVRFIVWVLLRHKGTGALVLHHDFHYVAGAWNAKKFTNKALRKQLWNEGNARHKAFVESWVKKGVAIAGGGDANRTKADQLLLGRTIGGKRVAYPVGNHSIDQLVFINGENWEWQIADSDGELLPGRNSDHQGRRANVRLVAA